MARAEAGLGQAKPACTAAAGRGTWFTLPSTLWAEPCRRFALLTLSCVLRRMRCAGKVLPRAEAVGFNHSPPPRPATCLAAARPGPTSPLIGIALAVAAGKASERTKALLRRKGRLCSIAHSAVLPAHRPRRLRRALRANEQRDGSVSRWALLDCSQGHFHSHQRASSSVRSRVVGGQVRVVVNPTPLQIRFRQCRHPLRVGSVSDDLTGLT